jgi:hypothetical protein
MAYDPIKNLEAQRRYRAKNREKILAKQRSPAAQETKRKWKAENPAKCVEYRRTTNARRKGANAAYMKEWRAINRDKRIAYNQKYHAEHRDHERAYFRLHYAENRDRILTGQAQYYLRVKSIKAIRHNPEDVYRVVSRAVSSTLPRFMRDDVINSMLLAVLEGKLLLEHVGARMKDYVTGYNREYDTYKTLSLDAPMGGTDLRRIDLLEAPAPYEPDEDEEDPDMAMLRGGQTLWR